MGYIMTKNRWRMYLNSVAIVTMFFEPMRLHNIFVSCYYLVIVFYSVFNILLTDAGFTIVHILKSEAINWYQVLMYQCMRTNVYVLRY